MDIKNDIIRIVKCDTVLNRFKYCNEFLDKWEHFLEKSYNSKVVYTIHNIDDKDQCFRYELPFGDNIIEFNFSIKYLRNFLNFSRKNNNTLIKIGFDNKNGVLSHGGFKCCYTKCDTFSNPSSSYDDLEDVLVVPMPVGDYGFLVVDGNHRVCSQISENKNNIIVTYLDYKIAAKSLSTPFEVAFYCFIEDLQKIRHNVGKIEHNKLSKTLNINKPERTLSIISERENI